MTNVVRNSISISQLAILIAQIIFLLLLSAPDSFAQERKGGSPKTREIFHQYRQEATIDRRLRKIVVGGKLISARYRLFAGPNGTEMVSPDRSLETGDCLAIFVEINGPEYISVTARHTNGTWEDLWPPTLGASSTGYVEKVSSGIRAPSEGCWQIHQPFDKDEVYVIISRSPHSEQTLLRANRISMAGVSNNAETAADSDRPANGQPMKGRDFVLVPEPALEHADGWTYLASQKSPLIQRVWIQYK